MLFPSSKLSPLNKWTLSDTFLCSLKLFSFIYSTLKYFATTAMSPKKIIIKLNYKPIYCQARRERNIEFESSKWSECKCDSKAFTKHALMHRHRKFQFDIICRLINVQLKKYWIFYLLLWWWRFQLCLDISWSAILHW